MMTCQQYPTRSVPDYLMPVLSVAGGMRMQNLVPGLKLIPNDLMREMRVVPDPDMGGLPSAHFV